MLGEPFKGRVKTFYLLREKADYRPEMFSKEFGGNIDLFRFSAAGALDQLQAEFRRYAKDVEGALLDERVGDHHDSS